MVTRMLMTTVAAFVLAAPVAAQDQVKPGTGQQMEQAQPEMQQQEQQTAPAGADEQPATAAQDQPTKPAPEAGADSMTAEDEAAPADAPAAAGAQPPATTAEDAAAPAADAPATGGAEPPAMTAEGEGAAPEPAAPATGAEPPAMTAEEEPAAEGEAEMAEEEAATPPAGMQFIEQQAAEQFLAADEVIGKAVVGAADEEVGEIADLVMDPDQKLVGVVLSVGGFLGIGEKWVAVPVESIQFPTDDEPARLLAEVTKEQLENAPDFVTRDTVEAEEAAAQAQQQQQMQPVPAPVPAPTTTTQ